MKFSVWAYFLVGGASLALLLDVHAKKQMDFFPVPVVESRPDEGESYGLMPVLVLANETGALKSIFGGLYQYNPLTRNSLAAIAYVYPHPEEFPEQVFEFYAEVAQDFYKEVDVHYVSAPQTWRYDLRFQYLKTPFARFYGFGPTTKNSDETSLIKSGLQINVDIAREILPFWRAHYMPSLQKVNLDEGVYPGTLSIFDIYSGAEFQDSVNFLHTFFIEHDTRPEGLFSSHGHLLQAGPFLTIKNFASDDFYYGYFLKQTFLHEFGQKYSLVWHSSWRQMFGESIPFYQQSALGGAQTLRAFIPNRFVAKGAVVTSIEWRWPILYPQMFGHKFTVSLDPFFEVGQVFDVPKQIQFSEWQPVGGLGLRLVVPPNVVARIDTAFGLGEYAVYTQLGYPF